MIFKIDRGDVNIYVSSVIGNQEVQHVRDGRWRIPLTEEEEEEFVVGGWFLVVVVVVVVVMVGVGSVSMVVTDDAAVVVWFIHMVVVLKGDLCCKQRCSSPRNELSRSIDRWSNCWPWSIPIPAQFRCLWVKESLMSDMMASESVWWAHIFTRVARQALLLLTIRPDIGIPVQ